MKIKSIAWNIVGRSVALLFLGPLLARAVFLVFSGERHPIVGCIIVIGLAAVLYFFLATSAHRHRLAFQSGNQLGKLYHRVFPSRLDAEEKMFASEMKLLQEIFSWVLFAVVTITLIVLFLVVGGIYLWALFNKTIVTLLATIVLLLIIVLILIIRFRI
jgi:hypothetical protein